MAQELATHLSDSMATFISHGNGHVADDSKISSCSGQQMKKEQENNIRVTLHNKDMWDKFHAVGTEMIITKAGRYTPISIFMNYFKYYNLTNSTPICDFFQRVSHI